MLFEKNILKRSLALVVGVAPYFGCGTTFNNPIYQNDIVNDEPSVQPPNSPNYFPTEPEVYDPLVVGVDCVNQHLYDIESEALREGCRDVCLIIGGQEGWTPNERNLCVDSVNNVINSVFGNDPYNVGKGCVETGLENDFSREAISVGCIYGVCPVGGENFGWTATQIEECQKAVRDLVGKVK